MLLTACEKGLVDGIADVAPTGQAANSVLQVRTRSGGSVGGEATVAYPVTVYVFSGEECRAVQTIGDEGQTLNIGLTEGTYSVYAVGDTYQGCYVLAVSTIDETSAELTLLSPNEQAATTTGNADAALAALGAVGISDWAVSCFLVNK